MLKMSLNRCLVGRGGQSGPAGRPGQSLTMSGDENWILCIGIEGGYLNIDREDGPPSTRRTEVYVYFSQSQLGEPMVFMTIPLPLLRRRRRHLRLVPARPGVCMSESGQSPHGVFTFGVYASRGFTSVNVVAGSGNSTSAAASLSSFTCPAGL